MKKKTILLGFLAIWCGLSILSAQVTIGKDVPAQATLDIIGDTANIHGQAFRLIDGNQGSGKIIMSNAGGIGTWTGAQQLLSQIPFIDIPQFFEARTGWTILTYGCQRYGRVFQFRLRIQNTTAISFDALTHKPLSNSLIAKTHIPPMRYIFYDAYPYSPTPYRNLTVNFNSFDLTLVLSDLSTTLPVNSIFEINGFFMADAYSVDFVNFLPKTDPNYPDYLQ